MMSQRIHGVDALRGIAACGIVILHAAYIHPIGIPEDAPITMLAMGVPLFFVISAFSMSVRYSSDLDFSSGSLLRFGVRRFARIAPLFYVMLTAWLVYLNHLGSPPPSFQAIFLNLTFLFGVSPTAQISLVPAGWSIGAEMLFYAAFPLLVRAKSMASCLGVLAAALVACAWFNGLSPSGSPDYFYWTHPLSNAPYFAFGLLAYRIYKRTDERSTVYGRRLIVLTLFLIGAAAAYTELTPEAVKSEPVDVWMVSLWGAAFCSLVLSQAIAPTVLLANRVTIFLGLISYSIYLVHPLLIHASPFTRTLTDWQTHWALKVFAASSLALAASVVAGSILYWLVEVRGQSLGKYLAGRASRREPAVPTVEITP